MQAQPQLFLMPSVASESRNVGDKLKLDLNLPRDSYSLKDFSSLKPSLISALTEKKGGSWISLIFVIAMHAGILILAIYAQKKDQFELPAITPMMVSLLDAPQNQPVSEPQKFETPKAEPQKQKPVIEKKAVPLTTDRPSPLQPVQEKSDTIKQEVATETKVSTSSESHVVDSKSPEAIDKAAQKEDVIEPPRFGVAYLNNPAPNYPGMSRRAREEGNVFLRVLVSETGDPLTVELVRSSQYERLDQAAIEAVKKWRFVPAKKNNQPYSTSVTFAVNFSLDK